MSASEVYRASEGSRMGGWVRRGGSWGNSQREISEDVSEADREGPPTGQAWGP